MPPVAPLATPLCERWCDEDHLGFGFKDETKSVLVTAGIVTDVAALESTQQEADMRVRLHSIHSVQKEDVERIIIHTNDPDTVVISCVYYAAGRFVGTVYVGSHSTR